MKRRRIRIEPSELVLEIVSIVIAIVLATAVGEWREGLRERADAQRSLTEIRAELVKNRARLGTLMPLHRFIYRGFGLLLKSHARSEILSADTFGSTFGAVAPHGINPFSGVDTAWQVSRVTGTVAHFDYGLLTKIETAYTVQDLVGGYRDRLIGDLHTETTTEKPNFYFVMQNFVYDFADLTANESLLFREYDTAITAIDNTGPH